MTQVPQIAGAKAPGSIFEALVLSSQLHKDNNQTLQTIMEQLKPLAADDGTLAKSLGELVQALKDIHMALTSLAEPLGQMKHALCTIADGTGTIKVRIEACSEEVWNGLRPPKSEGEAGDCRQEGFDQLFPLLLVVAVRSGVRLSL